MRTILRIEFRHGFRQAVGMQFAFFAGLLLLAWIVAELVPVGSSGTETPLQVAEDISTG